MADIFKEVDEDLRRDHAETLFRKYGPYIGGLVLLFILLFGGYQAWTWWDLKTRAEQSSHYQSALAYLSDGESDAAATELREVQAGGGNYGTLARFNEARLLAETGDIEGAIALWDQLAKGGDGGPALQGAAQLLAVLYQLESGEPAALEDRLQPLLEAGNGYRPLALEMSAILALRQGDNERAKTLYTEIADDLTAPTGLRGRAAQMLAALGG